MSLLQANTTKLMYFYLAVTLRIPNLTPVFSKKVFLNSSLLFMCGRLNTWTGSQAISNLDSLKHWVCKGKNESLLKSFKN